MNGKHKKSFWPFSSPAPIGPVVWMLGVFFFGISAPVIAGSITNQNGAPFIKAAAYQGILSIVSSQPVNYLEIGHTGRDIAGSSDLYFRPQSLSATSDPVGAPAVTNNLRIYKNSANQASLQVPGDVCSSSGSCTGTAAVDVNSNAANRDAVSGKLSQATNLKNAVYGSNASPVGFAAYFSGKVKIVNKAGGATGQLCFQDNTCQTTAFNGVVGGSQSLNDTLAFGNKSNSSVSLGSAPGLGPTTSGALLDVRAVATDAGFIQGTAQFQGAGAATTSADFAVTTTALSGSTCTASCTALALTCIIGWSSTPLPKTCGTVTASTYNCLCK